MNLVTEYLIIVDKKASEAFYHLCDNVNEFKKLLTSNDEISINGSEITYKENLNANYHVKTNKVGGKQQRFFHVKIIFNDDKQDMDEYVKLLRSIRGIVNRSGGQLETLWDDVSLYYSQESYPLIHKVENLMRKLITYFMLTNIGKWVTQTSPAIVMNAIDKSKRKQYFDVLHQIDFIHLGDFLFKPYQIKDTKELLKLIAEAKKIDDLLLDELKAFEAKSNWEKYFSKIVDCTDEFLDKRWKDLYELRCSVAHNALINKDDYERVSRLVSEIELPLQKALDNLDKVHVPQADKEQVTENVISNINATFGEFIQVWKSFENAILKAEIDLGISTTEKNRNLRKALQVLKENEDIDEEFYKQSIELMQFRNQVIHDSRIDFTEAEIRGNLEKLDELVRTLKRSWKDEIYNAIVQLGGEAVLPDIYEYIESHSTRKLPSTWQATVRYVLQLYCSSTETYKGGDDIFVHVERGKWGVKFNPIS